MLIIDKLKVVNFNTSVSNISTQFYLLQIDPKMMRDQMTRFIIGVVLSIEFDIFVSNILIYYGS